MRDGRVENDLSFFLFVLKIVVVVRWFTSECHTPANATVENAY